MMTSNDRHSRAYVWAWLPDTIEPIVTGVLEPIGDTLVFNYARSYLARDNATSLYAPELPLQLGRIRPRAGLRVAGCINDGAPDAWGQRVVDHRRLSQSDGGKRSTETDLLTYLLESGSDRFGALDFQISADTYISRASNGTLEELRCAAQ